MVFMSARIAGAEHLKLSFASQITKTDDGTEGKLEKGKKKKLVHIASIEQHCEKSEK